MARFGAYPKEPFSPDQNFLARNPSSSGEVIRVQGQSILDAAVDDLKNKGEIVQAIDTLTAAIATNYQSGTYVLTGGGTLLFDGDQAIYRVSDPGSGGIVMANGNELVLFFVANTPANIITPVASIDVLPAVVVGNVTNAAGYHPGTTVGGDDFLGVAAARHNGGTNIDPDRVAEFGTAAYYVDSGSDAACHVRLDVGYITADMFGAQRDGVIDAQPAFNAALISQSALGGGIVDFDAGYLIDSDLDIPANCGIRGTLQAWKQETTNEILDDGANGILFVNSAATLDVTNNSSLTHLTIARKGLQIGETAQGALFAGIAVSSINVVFGTSSGSISHVQILGFAQAIKLQQHHRFNIDHVSGDNLAGIIEDESSDVLNINDIHFWPFVTRTTAGGLDRHHRSGVALELKGQIDIPQVTNVFTYGYLKGLYLNGNVSIGAGTFQNIHCDNTKLFAGSRGVHIEGDCTYSVFSDSTTFSQDKGFLVEVDSTDIIHFVNCRSISNAEDAWRINSGTAVLTDCTPAQSVNGVRVEGASAVADISHCSFMAITVANIIAGTNGKVRERSNIFDTASSIGGWTLKTLASVDPLTLPETDDDFIITGTTGIGTLNGGWPGRTVNLSFTAILTMFDGATMNLAGNLVTAAGTTLVLAYNGTQWEERSRSVN